MSSHRSVFGSRAQGLRLERMRSSPRFDGGVFRNTHAVTPGLKSGTVLPTLTEYLRGGQQRKPTSALPVVSPLGGLGEADRDGPPRHLARPLHRARRD